MPRIAIGIEDVHRRGGQERVVCELLWRLADRHDIDLICYRAEDVPGTLRVVPVPDRMRAPQFLRALWFIHASRAPARRGGYDVVLAQGSNMWRPNFVLAHTCHAQRIRNRRQGEWRRHPPNWRTRLQFAVRDRIMYGLERRAVRRCRGRIIAIDDVCKRELQLAYGLGDGEIVVCENGVDHETFHPGLRNQWRGPIRGELGLTDDEFVVLFMGGLWHEKGLPLLIEALPLMQERASLVVVGRGDEEEYGRRADALGVRERVVFAGFTPHPERYFAMADCFAFLSEAEGLALVQLEAAACGLPLMLLRDYAPPPLVEDGVSGFLVPPDAAALAPRLDALAADPDLRRRAGEASHQRSLRYSWDRQAREIEAFILERLPPRGRRGL